MVVGLYLAFGSTQSVTQPSQTATEPSPKSYVEKLSDNKWKAVIDGRVIWFDTGINIDKDTVLEIHATGQVTWAPPGSGYNMSGTVSPDGTRPPLEEHKATFPMPEVGCSSLIMKVGDNKYSLGSDATVTVQSRGTIKLMVNDDNIADNSGNFTVFITRK